VQKQINLLEIMAITSWSLLAAHYDFVMLLFGMWLLFEDFAFVWVNAM
jgi:hypothetical protein